MVVYGVSMSIKNDEHVFLIIFGIIFSIYVIYIFIPSLAVAIRRLHDTGKSGCFFLFIFIPFVGDLIFLIFCVEDSQPFTNIYGPSPKYINQNNNPINGYIPPQGNVVLVPSNFVVPNQGNMVYNTQGNVILPSSGNVNTTPIYNPYPQNNNIV